MLRRDVGNHDSSAVAAQAVSQDLSHHGVPVGNMRPLLSHAPFLWITCMVGVLTVLTDST